jgi:hypothetical protein
MRCKGSAVCENQRRSIGQSGQNRSLWIGDGCAGDSSRRPDIGAFIRSLPTLADIRGNAGPFNLVVANSRMSSNGSGILLKPGNI